MAFTVGLTGGIGSGKTTVAELFASRGAGIVDTDEISRRLTAPAQPAVIEIARKFGPQFIAADGSLDRAQMRHLVFADPSARKDLEAILHPLIRQESTRQIYASAAPYVVIVVPLLIETGSYRDMIGRILVVDCEPETQIRRVMERSGLSRNDVLAIIASQVPRQQRLREADDVIHNDGALEALRAQVSPLHLRYLGLATNG
ncbi:MAG TPA: dephospho-CoA kinase [Burkholderiales bacterium]|jgi:dephospho-CoA kinase